MIFVIVRLLKLKINFENGIFFKIVFMILLAYALGKEALLGFWL